MRPPRARAPASDLDVEAVVFDMDGLLLDTERLARQALRWACAQEAIELPESLSHQLIGVPADRCRRLMVEHYGEGIPVDRIFVAAACLLEAEMDRGPPLLKPGVPELLAGLDERAMPRGVATSSSRSKARHHLRAAGLEDCFDIVVTRDDVACGKPAPDLYLHAARGLHVAPSRCLALEDSYNGVRAAHAAGMPVIMVPDLLPPTGEMRDKCHAILADLHRVLPLLMAGQPRL